MTTGDISSIFSEYAKAIGLAESHQVQLQTMLRQVMTLIEQNALDLNLNVYERATLKSVTIKLKAIEDEFKHRKAKKVLQPNGSKRFSFRGEGRNRRYSSTDAPGSSRKADAPQP